MGKLIALLALSACGVSGNSYVSYLPIPSPIKLSTTSLLCPGSITLYPAPTSGIIGQYQVCTDPIKTGHIQVVGNAGYGIDICAFPAVSSGSGAEYLQDPTNTATLSPLYTCAPGSINASNQITVNFNFENFSTVYFNALYITSADNVQTLAMCLKTNKGNCTIPFSYGIFR